MRHIWTTERKIIGGFGLALLVLCAVAAISVWLTVNLLGDLEAVSDQNETLTKIADANSLMPQMAAAARVYAVPANRTDANFQEWEKARKDFENALDSIDAATSESSEQRARLAKIRAILEPKVKATNRDTDQQALEDLWGIKNGVAQMRPVGDLLLDISREERNRLGSRNKEAQPKAIAALMAIGLASVLAVIMVTGAVIMILRDLRSRAAAAAELVRAREAAEAASVAKSAFLANMSHELRTPLTSIMGYADLLLDQQASVTRRQEFLQTLRRSGEHLLLLINDILDVSKIEAGRMTVEIVPSRLIDILADLDSLMRSRAVDKGLEFGIEYLTPVPDTVMTDPTRFRQIVMNLVGNALKFTDEGSVRVRVSYAPPQQHNGHAERPRLMIDVSDTGIGISPQQQTQLFQPFAQADHSTTRRFGGTGLGLSISRRLAQKLGGELTVRSTLGEGSTFTFNVPMDVAPNAIMTAPADAARRVSGVEPETVPVHRNLRMRILLAEDGAENRDVIMLHLKRAGCELTAAEDGQQAYEMALKSWRLGNAFDVILMDMQMPVLDGYTATSKLRAEGYPGPIIAITAHAMQEDRVRCLRAGCDEYASKPVDMPALLGMLSRIGGDGRVAGDAGTPGVLEDSNPALQQLTRKFVEGLRASVDAMRDMCRRQMWESAASAAHRLAGAGGAYGFPDVTRESKNLERALRGATPADWQPALEALEQVCTAAVTRLQPTAIIAEYH